MSASNNIWQKIESAPMVRIGEFIDKFSLKNKEGINFVSGVNIFKEFISTVADLNGTDITKYQVVPQNCFACNLMHVGRDYKIPIAYNYSKHPVVVSPAYDTFKIKDSKQKEILADYLILAFKCNELDRLAGFYCDSSIRGNLQWERFCDILIPIPSINTQQELVAVYNGLKNLAEENEALLQPLSDACQAFIVDCKEKYPLVNLGDYIEEYDEKNVGNVIKEVRSVSVYKDFRLTNAKVNKDELSGYKIVPPFHIAYVQTTKNEKCFAHALNSTNRTYVVSAVDRVIKSKDNDILDISFLSLFLRRKEFDRFAIFNSWGSAREVFSFEDLCAVQIPLPPTDVQQSIVNLYRCYEEAKQIAAQAREQLKTICPALIQKAAHSA